MEEPEDSEHCCDMLSSGQDTAFVIGRHWLLGRESPWSSYSEVVNAPWNNLLPIILMQATLIKHIRSEKDMKQADVFLGKNKGFVGDKEEYLGFIEIKNDQNSLFKIF